MPKVGAAGLPCQDLLSLSRKHWAGQLFVRQAAVYGRPSRKCVSCIVNHSPCNAARNQVGISLVFCGASCLTTCRTSLCLFQFSLPAHCCLTPPLILCFFLLLLLTLPFLRMLSPRQLGRPQPALLVLLLPRIFLRLVSRSSCPVGPDPCSVGWAFCP